MARPKIGIFGALMALGGFLAVRYVQRNRAAQAQTGRDLSRWEDEGGAVATPSPSSAPSGSVSAASASSGAHGANGSAHPDAWPFPHSH
ncbi:hypothetical protein [Paraburkholderia rhynchosiae]|uniref:Uncharacterized protein n=1 Tax=Paraburkholderia rhynchosiae TaxID=487049 RepID=A0A2N7WXE7_9BURK|nr:hypothetical protein [Paraburkholderia rhynchosiae]PMS34034.1 hypothetical protein C0Z16_00225 [Paraburkholderia rhynchosiae]CAB3636133.1 hypothetical protein LMG27174_00043 [Paraburkholderia rhynchosiae]